MNIKLVANSLVAYHMERRPGQWENWARKKIGAFVIWCWRRVIRVSRMERKTNEWVLEKHQTRKDAEMVNRWYQRLHLLTCGYLWMASGINPKVAMGGRLWQQTLGLALPTWKLAGHWQTRRFKIFWRHLNMCWERDEHGMENDVMLQSEKQFPFGS